MAEKEIVMTEAEAAAAEALRVEMSNMTGTQRAAVLTLLLGGCAAQREHGRGLDLLEQGKLAEGIDSLRRANSLEPDNVRYRVDYLNQRGSAIQGIVAAADAERIAGRLDAAGLRLREAARIEPSNDRVKAGLQAIEAERRLGAGHGARGADHDGTLLRRRRLARLLILAACGNSQR